MLPSENETKLLRKLTPAQVGDSQTSSSLHPAEYALLKLSQVEDFRRKTQALIFLLGFESAITKIIHDSEMLSRAAGESILHSCL